MHEIDGVRKRKKKTVGKGGRERGWRKLNYELHSKLLSPPVLKVE